MSQVRMVLALAALAWAGLPEGAAGGEGLREAVGAPAGTRPTGGQVLARVEGTYGRLEVVEVGGLRILACDGVVQGAVPVSGMQLLPGTLIRARDYVELIPYYRPDTRTTLLIGLGAGIHARTLGGHGIRVHAVDVEPAIVPLAREHFSFTGEVTEADGRAFVRRTERRFDAVVLDTFQGETVPQHLYTREAFASMSERLTPGGVLAVHLIARPQHPATQAIARTLAAVFEHTAAYRSGFGEEIQHIYVLASRKPLELRSEQRLELDSYGFTGEEYFVPQTGGAPLLTDRGTRLKELCRDLAAEHRRRSENLLRRSSW